MAVRLDKALADMSFGTRSEVKEFIRKGKVTVNGVVIKKADFKVTSQDEIILLGQEVGYVDKEYYLLNKPQGYVTATEDSLWPVVMDLIASKRKDLFPVGRLDKDTEGALLITNDGDMSHSLLSPRNHIDKTYYVEVENDLPDNAKDILENGIEFKDFTTKQASYQKLSERSAYLTISEGKFHQVKRMFEKVGCPVTFLKRVKFGPLTLDGLETGEFRELTEQEVNLLKEFIEK